MARIVLDPGAVAQLAHHLEVERRALAETGALERPALGLELPDALLHLDVDVGDRGAELVRRGHVVAGRVDVRLLPLGEQLAGQRVQLGDPLDLVAEELDPDEAVLRGRLELERVAADAEPGAGQRLVVALVLEVDEVAQHGVAAVLAADAQLEHGRAVVDGCAEAVDARDARDDDHVAPLEQRVGRRVPQPVDLVVAARVLLDVGVAPGQVRLGLVVVEVADEVLDGVVREELAELGVELRGERLVVGDHERRPVGLLDDRRHREGLARPGGAQQRLVALSALDTVDELGDRVGLIAGRLERGDEVEVGHGLRIRVRPPGRVRYPGRTTARPRRQRDGGCVRYPAT